MRLVKFFFLAIILAGLLSFVTAPVTAQSTATVSGTVIDAVAGQPVVGASVSVGLLSTTSGANGTYSITGISAGTPNIVASKSGYRSRTINSYPIGLAANITQNIALTPSAVDVGIFHGYVVDTFTGNNLYGVRLELADGIVVHSWGYYYIYDVPLGRSYNLTASYSSYHPRRAVGVRVGEGIGFNPPLGATTYTYLDFALTTEGAVVMTISGNVSSNTTGAAIAGARVSAGFGLVAVTAADGSYTLDNLPRGSYYLQAYRSGYESATAQVTAANLTQNFTLNLNTGAGYIWGNVRNISTNSRLDGAVVSLGGRTVMTQRAPTGAPIYYSDGHYIIYGLNPGNYTLDVSQTGYFSRSSDAVVVSHQSGTQAGMALTPVGTLAVTLRGNVKNSVTDSPLAQAKVWVDSDIGVLTDSSGNYTIPDLPTGRTFDLRASLSGYRERLINALPTGSLQGVTITQNIALTPSAVDVGIFHGYVVDTFTGNNLYGVRLELADGIVVHSWGYYYIYDVPLGRSYNLTASYSSYHPRRAVGVRVGEGVGFNPPLGATAYTYLDFALTTQGAEVITVSGNVSRATDGSALTGARISAGFGLVAVTGADGSYTLDNLPRGSYYLQAYRSGYESATVPVTAANLTQNFTLNLNTGAGYIWGNVRNISTNSRLDGAVVSLGGRTVMTQRAPTGAPIYYSDGHYIIYGLASGAYQAVATHPLYLPAILDVTVPHQAGIQKDIGLQPRGIAPAAKIIQPKQGDVLSGVVTITGTAYDDDFASYKLEYSTTSKPQDWYLIGEQTAPVLLGKLTDWDVSQMYFGIYNLRLTARDQQANQTTDSIQVSIGGQAVTVTINAPSEVRAGDNFTATVDIAGVENFDAANYDVSFNGTLLRLDNVTSGNITGSEIPVDFWAENVTGTFRIVQNVPGTPGISGSGYLAVLHFFVVGSANTTSEITLSNGVLSDNLVREIPATWGSDSVYLMLMLPGDANGDGNINALDITKVERIIVGFDAPTLGADANRDGNINALDITKIERIIVRLD